ncbi:anti-sigma-I factor RsgI family protein, partial [Paenibacillus darwinianus]|uniref:anti-sigma-I factor RsgI family protein n=1 Tax=Paenibacillus darwinianus TaxID=1380763 RepID=UPI000563B11B
MSETKGIVMKITDQIMVVMCDDGKFRNLPLPVYVPAIGERIIVALSQSKRKRLSSYWMSTAVACIFMLIGFGIWQQAQPQYDQVVAIEINPSLELFLNAQGQVVKAKPLNADAENVLRAASLDKLRLNDAIKQILAKSIDLGYINRNKNNMIMIAAANLKGRAAINEAALEDIVAETLQANNMAGFVHAEQTDKGSYEQARKRKISINKWLLIQQIQQYGVSLNMDNAVTKSAEYLLEGAGLRKEQFFVPIPIPFYPAKDGQKLAEQPEEQPASPTDSPSQGQSESNQTLGPDDDGGTVLNPVQSRNPESNTANHSRPAGSSQWIDAAGSSGTPGVSGDANASPAPAAGPSGASAAAGQSG